MRRFSGVLLFLCAMVAFACIVISLALPDSSESSAITAFTARLHIGSEGETAISADYVADGRAQDIRIETKLQKRFLLVFWKDVDGGQWTDSFTTTEGSFSHTLQLEKTGRYRAVFHIYAVGTDGSVDDFELVKDCTYG